MPRASPRVAACRAQSGKTEPAGATGRATGSRRSIEGLRIASDVFIAPLCGSLRLIARCTPRQGRRRSALGRLRSLPAGQASTTSPPHSHAPRTAPQGGKDQHDPTCTHVRTNCAIVLLDKEHLTIGRQRPEIGSDACFELVRQLAQRIHHGHHLPLHEAGLLNRIFVFVVVRLGQCLQ